MVYEVEENTLRETSGVEGHKVGFSYVGSGLQTVGSGGRGLCTSTSCFSAPKPYRCYHHFLLPGDT